MPLSRLSQALLAGIFLIILSSIYYRNRTEDFMYYYCQGWVASHGQSPYDPVPFQACLAQALGRPNSNISRDSGSAYPPSTLALFFPLSRVPYRAAFALWSFILLFSGLGIVWQLVDQGLWTWLLILTWPGLLLNLAYHKFSLILFPFFLLGMNEILSGAELRGGGFLGVLSLQPQWFLGALLPLIFYKKWRGFAAAAAAAVAISLGFSLIAGSFSLWPAWVTSSFAHSNLLVSLDNQSLFVALYKPFRYLLPGPTPALQITRYAVSLLLLAAAYIYARRSNFKNFLWPYMGIYLLALPYSHGSDLLWVLPLFLATLKKFPATPSCSENHVAAAALAVFGAASLLAGGYLPPSLGSVAFQYVIGFGSFLLVGFEFYSNWA